MLYIYIDGFFNSVFVIGFKIRVMIFVCMNVYNYMKGKVCDYVFI